MESICNVCLLSVMLLVVAVYPKPTPHRPPPAPSLNPTTITKQLVALSPAICVRLSALVSTRASNLVVAGLLLTIGSALGWILGAVGAIAIAVIGRVVGQLALDGLEESRARKRLNKEPHTLKEIKRWAADRSSVYIQPDCQDNDPTIPGRAEQRRPVFAELDKLLGPPHAANCIMILADSGMGKSSLLSKYYAYHWVSSNRSSRFKLVVVPLNRRDVTALIERVPARERSETVLFLDALDEDRGAIANYTKRLEEIADLTATFACVVVTCRTQFFLTDADIHLAGQSQQTSYTQGFGQSPPVPFKKLYLSPFSSAQTKKYLRRRFLWRLHILTYLHARLTAERFADLVSRPMLLTYIQNLVQAKKAIKYAFEVYEVIVNEWLRWEVENKRLARDAKKLLEFSHKLAGELFAQGRNRISLDELRGLARDFSVDVNVQDIQRRSLLNRDAEGNWKFAHRSIQEYLLVRECALAKAPPTWTGPDWTDQMREFAREMIRSGECGGLPGADLRGLDLRDVKFGRFLLSGTSLDDADLSGANLENVRGLSVPRVLVVRSDAKTRWPVQTFTGHRLTGYMFRVQNCAVSPTGDYFVSASGDKMLKVWDAATGKERHTLLGHTDWVLNCAISPNGDYIVSTSRDKTLKVWDPATGEELRTLRGHTSEVYDCAVSPNGHFIVSASHDRTLKVWDAATGEELHTLTGQHTVQVTCCAVSPKADYIVSASPDGTLNVWDAATRKELHTLTGHTGHGQVLCCAVSPKGDYIVSASLDKTLKVWDAATGKELHTLTGHTDWVLGCAVSPEGDYIVSTSRDNTLKLWDAATGKTLHTLTGHTKPVQGYAVSPQGNYIVSASEDNTLRVWFPPETV